MATRIYLVGPLPPVIVKPSAAAAELVFGNALSLELQQAAEQSVTTQARLVAIPEVVVVSYKGFDAEFKCRGFQYEIGATYQHKGDVAACSSGFHACENPFDVWGYYPLLNDDAKPNRFAVVEQSGSLSRHDEDSKIASASITITAELTIPEFVKRSVNWLLDHCKSGAKDGENVQAASGHYSKLAASGHSSKLAASGHSSKLAASGHYSQLAASGDSSQLAASGHSSKLAASGDYSKLAASGDSSQLAASGNSSQLAASGDSSKLAASGHSSQLAASGNYSQLAASGDSSQLAASGNYSKLAASGDSSQLAASGHSSKLAASGNYSQLAASGDSSQLAASGNSSQLAASGNYSVIASSSYNGLAKGVDGTWIALAEYNSDGKCVGFATGCIGKDGLLADTYYRARDGKLIAA